MPAIDPETSKNVLLTALGYVAGALTAIGTIVGGIAKLADISRKRRMRDAENDGMDSDDAKTSHHYRELGADREDTAVIALRRITADAQRDAECARVALEMSERESKHLRARLVEAERELAQTASELAAKTYALDAASSRLETAQATVAELRARCGHLEALTDELRGKLNGLIDDDGHAIRIGQTQSHSQRPTPPSGLHAAVPEVVMPRPSRVPIESEETPRPRGLPPVRPGKR